MSTTFTRSPIAAIAAPAPRNEGAFFSSRRAKHLRRLLIFSAITASLAGRARADIDMVLNTSDFVSGQASTLSVDGTVTASGDSTAITATTITVRFDPAKITLSNLHVDSSTAWTLLAYNTDHLADGWAKAVLLNTDADGQTADGPILLFTVTPVDSTVDANDCDTLKLSASESDMADQGFNTVYPSDACAGTIAPSTPSESSPDGSNNTALVVNEVCEDNLPLTEQALKIAGGLQSANTTDLANFDRDLDGKVTILDAVAVLRSPCPSGWYTFQGDERRTGRTPFPLASSPSSRWVDNQGQPSFVQLPGFIGNGTNYSPTVLAIPYSAASYLPVLYAVSSTTEGTQHHSTVYRIRDTGDGAAPSAESSFTFDGVVSGTPLYYNGKLWIAANNGGTGYVYVLNAKTMTKALIATTNPIAYGGTADSSPVSNANMGMVVVAANTSTGTNHSGALFCYSAGDARLITSFALNSGSAAATACSPVCRGDYVYVGDGSKGIDWLNLRTNATGRFDTGLVSAYTLAVHGNKLVAGSGPGASALQWTISDTDGSLSAQRSIGGAQSNVYSTPAYVAESAASLFNYESGWLYGFHTKTDGDLENQFAGFQAVPSSDNSPLICGAPGTTSPVALILPYQGGGQIVKVSVPLDPAPTQIPQHSTLVNSPALVNGDGYGSSFTAFGTDGGTARIYFLTNNGRLYCFQ